VGFVKSEQAKGLILEKKKKMVAVVAMYHLLLFFHARPAKHPTITVVTLKPWFLTTTQ
jgi:hypothetical protein